MQTITQPGKFEGELECIPQMWDIALEGFGAEVWIGETLYSFVSLYGIGSQPVDGLYGACLWERSDGFVCSEWYATEDEYNTAIRALEAEAERYDDNEDAESLEA